MSFPSAAGRGAAGRSAAGKGAAGLLVAFLSLGWLLASPASAENLTLTLDSPVEGRRYERSTVTVEGRVNTALLTNVDRVRVTVTRLYDDFVLDHAIACESCGSESSIPFSYTTPTLSYNGPYRVQVVASGHLLVNGIPVDDASAERSFTVAVRPAAPANLRAERLADNKVKLTWGAVPAYPDLIGYMVYRAAPGATLKPLRSVTGGSTSYVDDQTVGGGNFQYKVAAVRSGAVPGDSSQWLLAESNLATIDVPPPANPTTTGISLPPGSNPPETSGAGNDPGATSLDLGRFFNSAAADIRLPPPSLPSTSSIQLPDTGFSQNLPFGSAGGLPPPTQSARPAATAPGQPTAPVADQDDGEANRRALLVPVAAGSVMCVAALHLRWLSRRLAVPPLGADGAGFADLEPAEPELDGEDLEAVREPVAAGTGPGPRPG